MSLLPSWCRHHEKTSSSPVSVDLLLPKRPGYYREAVRRLETIDALSDFVDFARQRPLACVGLAFAYHYVRPGVEVGSGHLAWDPRSITPTHLTVALSESGEGDRAQTCAAIIDLKQPGLAAALRPLLDLAVPFVGHDVGLMLQCLWQLGLEVPRVLWDTRIHERVRFLGHCHRRYAQTSPVPDQQSEMASRDSLERAREQQLSLVATCDRYDVIFPFSAADDRLRESTDMDRPATEADVTFALASTLAAIHLYPRQVMHAVSSGRLHHLTAVEMPWVVTNARMVWTGIRVAPLRREATRALAERTRSQLGATLRARGLNDPGNDIELEGFFSQIGVLQYFASGIGYRFDKAALERAAALHPAVRLIHHWRRARNLCADKLLWPQLVGADGRIHPEIRQLGAETGRQSSRWPNILGVSRWLRPTVVPEAGCGIGEVDWAQVELGVAGAHFGDGQLVAMFNTGDVYAAMAQLFFEQELSEADRKCSSAEFRQHHPKRREQMKVCTLGMLYGLGEAGLAQQLSVSRLVARSLLEHFRKLFPVLFEAQHKEVVLGGLRGYATTVTGLRRYRAHNGACSAWERNWLGNHPVQGSAADVFKLAGIRLDAHYPRFGARLLVPLHDAYIFEVPMERLETVAAFTARVMTETLQEIYPVLQPRVTVNIAHPECWNKDGMTDPMAVWQDEVEAALRAVEGR